MVRLQPSVAQDPLHSWSTFRRRRRWKSRFQWWTDPVPGVAGCISNDLFRDASAEGIDLSSVRVKVNREFTGEPAVSEETHYEVEVSGDAPEERLRQLIDKVDEVAEIPNSLRQGTSVRLVGATVQ